MTNVVGATCSRKLEMAGESRSKSRTPPPRKVSGTWPFRGAGPMIAESESRVSEVSGPNGGQKISYSGLMSVPGVGLRLSVESLMEHVGDFEKKMAHPKG